MFFICSHQGKASKGSSVRQPHFPLPAHRRPSAFCPGSGLDAPFRPLLRLTWTQERKIAQEALSRRFAEEHPNRFDGVGYQQSKHGIPVLDGVLASIECEKQAEVPGGDHSVFFGIVTGGSVSDRRPLLYYRGGYAGLTGG